MKDPRPKIQSHKESNTIAKELLVGLLAIVLGGYNLLTSLGVVKVFVDIPQIVGNIVLVLAGLFLCVTAYKLYRHRYFTSRIF